MIFVFKNEVDVLLVELFELTAIYLSHKIDENECSKIIKKLIETFALKLLKQGVKINSIISKVACLGAHSKCNEINSKIFCDSLREKLVSFES